MCRPTLYNELKLNLLKCVFKDFDISRRATFSRRLFCLTVNSVEHFSVAISVFCDLLELGKFISIL